MTAPATPRPSARARRERALLILEDGTVLRGSAYGARGARFGEVEIGRASCRERV